MYADNLLFPGYVMQSLGSLPLYMLFPPPENLPFYSLVLYLILTNGSDFSGSIHYFQKALFKFPEVWE